MGLIVKPGVLVMLTNVHNSTVYGILICQHRLKLRSTYWKVFVAGSLVMLKEDEFIPICMPLF